MKKSYFIYTLCASTMLAFSAWALNDPILTTPLDPVDLEPDGPTVPITPETPTVSDDKVDLGDRVDIGDTGGTTGGSTNLGDLDLSGGTVVDEGGGTSGGDVVEYIPNPDSLDCHNVSCAALGYAQATIANCESYIKCPFDVSYQACAKYKDDFTLSACPAGATCEGKFKMTGCQEGYIARYDAHTGLLTSCSAPVEVCTYTLTKCPTGWECNSCSKGGTTYYEKTGKCAIGYLKGSARVLVRTL